MDKLIKEEVDRNRKFSVVIVRREITYFTYMVHADSPEEAKELVEAGTWDEFIEEETVESESAGDTEVKEWA
jgi:hypothetical protein